MSRLEALLLRGRLRAAERARARAAALAGRLREELPPGVAVEESGDGVALLGKGLKRRFALEPALRALIGGER